MPTIEAEAVDGLALAEALGPGTTLESVASDGLTGMDGPAQPCIYDDFEWGADGTDIEASGGRARWRYLYNNASYKGVTHELDTSEKKSGTASFEIKADTSLYAWWYVSTLTWGTRARISWSSKVDAGAGEGRIYFMWNDGPRITLVIYDTYVYASGFSYTFPGGGGQWHDFVIDDIDYSAQTFRVTIDGVAKYGTFSGSSGQTNAVQFMVYNGSHGWVDNLEARVESYVAVSPSASDGAKGSESLTPGLTLSPALTDGSVHGDSDASLVEPQPLAADGLVVRDPPLFIPSKADDFEWGSDGDPISKSLSGIAWTSYAPGTCLNEIDTSQVYGGTRSFRQYRDGSNWSHASFDLKARSYAYSIKFMACNGTLAGWNFRHGNGTYLLHIGCNSTQAMFYYNHAGTWTSLGLTHTVGQWKLIELRNLDFVNGYFDYWYGGVFLGRLEMMALNESVDIARFSPYTPTSVTGEVWHDDVEICPVGGVDLALSPAVTDGGVFSEVDVLSIALSLALADGMTLADALAVLTQPQPVAADGFTWLDELNKIYQWLEEGVSMGDSTRERLPYLYKVSRKKEAYTLGKLSDNYNLGSSQKRYGIGD